VKCLITGGAGFIGGFAAEKLLAEGYEVTLFDNLREQVHGGKAPDYLPKDAHLVVGDVRDRDALAKEVKRADWIVHLAAAVGVAQSQYEIRDYCDNNVTGTATLCDILAKEKHHVSKLMVASSMTLYGEGVYKRPSDGALVRPPVRTEADVAKNWEPLDPDTGEALVPWHTPETAALHGPGVYAVTKRAQEDLVLNMDATYDIPSVALRFFNVYGPRQSLNNPYTGVLAIFISRALNGKAPLVYEDGKQTRDFIHVRDVADAIFASLAETVRDARINIGSGRGTEIGELAAKLCGRINPDLKPDICGKFRKGDIRHCVADNTLAIKRLTLKPSVCSVSLEEGIEDLLNWSASQTPVDNSEKALAELEKFKLGARGE